MKFFKAFFAALALIFYQFSFHAYADCELEENFACTNQCYSCSIFGQAGAIDYYKVPRFQFGNYIAGTAIESLVINNEESFWGPYLKAGFDLVLSLPCCCINTFILEGSFTYFDGSRTFSSNRLLPGAAGFGIVFFDIVNAEFSQAIPFPAISIISNAFEKEWRNYSGSFELSTPFCCGLFGHCFQSEPFIKFNFGQLKQRNDYSCTFRLLPNFDPTILTTISDVAYNYFLDFGAGLAIRKELFSRFNFYLKSNLLLNLTHTNYHANQFLPTIFGLDSFKLDLEKNFVGIKNENEVGLVLCCNCFSLSFIAGYEYIQKQPQTVFPIAIGLVPDADPLHTQGTHLESTSYSNYKFLGELRFFF